MVFFVTCSSAAAYHTDCKAVESVSGTGCKAMLSGMVRMVFVLHKDHKAAF